VNFADAAMSMAPAGWFSPRFSQAAVWEISPGLQEAPGPDCLLLRSGPATFGPPQFVLPDRYRRGPHLPAILLTKPLSPL